MAEVVAEVAAEVVAAAVTPVAPKAAGLRRVVARAAKVGGAVILVPAARLQRIRTNLCTQRMIRRRDMAMALATPLVAVAAANLHSLSLIGLPARVGPRQKSAT